MSVSPLLGLRDAVCALRPLVMQDYDVRPLRLWAELNVEAQKNCAHCQVLGEEGASKVEEILDLLERSK